MLRLLTIFIFITIGLSLIPSCNKSPDQKAYEEVLATMSMDKAKKFFDSYPKSRYRDRLVTTIIEWCRQENTEECYTMILNALPKNHRQYIEVSNYYENQFKGKKEK